MHSLRRSALRSTLAAARSAAPRAQATTPFRSALALRHAQVDRTSAALALRFFSHSSRVANAEEGAQTEFAAADQGSGGGADGETPYALFIRNMVFDANEQHLKEAFAKYGEIAKVAIARDARGLSRGYGFVWFNNQEEMNKAAVEANGSFWHGRRIQVQPRSASPKQPRGPREPSRTLYIGNIPYETTDAELNNLFRDLDGVTDVRVAVDRTTGWPRGFAHADFADVESCVKAREKLDGQALGGRELRFDYAAVTARPRASGQEQQ